ncbi:olfactomedin-like protein 3A isoform X2 [Synchiropus splendidus]|uniref:olfactomedin-like protein 3A isoform X2 n=1 Tax=Synchiropus splendidus TaxID=270530 RepID=UPI00237D7475|nr:olfactomedin-like protein 3A isoform X2 [Synchiropus splendidus]
MPQMRPGSGRVGEGGWTVPHLDQNLSAAGTDDRSESGSDWVEPVPNMDRSFILLLALCLTCSPVRSQSPGQDSFIIQYLERRLLQMEERLSRCEQNTARLTQTTYDLSSQVRAHRSTVHVLQSEVRSQVDGVSARVDRVERELEYLEKKIPLSSDIQMEEALLEQQIQAAELELIQNRAKLQLQSDCSVALSQIKSLKIVKKTGDVSGSWFKDPTAGSQKIYLLSGVRNHTLLEFGSLQSFSSNATPPPRVLQLPASWQGTGHVVYGGFLFYHKADTPNQILKVSLESGGVVDSALLPGAGRLPVYGLNPDTYLHLAVDQLGLWVLHADPDYAGNLILTKLDKGGSTSFLPREDAAACLCLLPSQPGRGAHVGHAVPEPRRRGSLPHLRDSLRGLQLASRRALRRPVRLRHPPHPWQASGKVRLLWCLPGQSCPLSAAGRLPSGSSPSATPATAASATTPATSSSSPGTTATRPCTRWRRAGTLRSPLAADHRARVAPLSPQLCGGFSLLLNNKPLLGCLNHWE